MIINNENTFKHALQEGINLFIGAGFSILAKDESGKNLPLGRELCKELCVEFHKPEVYTLPQLSTILEASNKEPFYTFLERRFCVGQFDPLYKALFNINIRSIYTTNIDDLIPKLFQLRADKFLNNQMVNGATEDKNKVNYLPLHGSINMEMRKYVFDVSSLANIYNDVPRIWSCLSREIEMRPTLFLGYSFSDTSVVQAITSQQTFSNARKDIWILLREEEAINSEFYESLGFHVIQGDIRQILTYFNSYSSSKQGKSKIERERYELLSSYKVPSCMEELKVQRPIKDFFAGSSPQWCDVLSNQLFKTHYFPLVMNSLYDSTKHTIIIGGPVCGKTTLLKQVAVSASDFPLKLYFESLSKERADFIRKLVGKDKTAVFIDSLYDSLEAIEILKSVPNIKLVCAERSHNFGIVSHLVDSLQFHVINVTALSDYDLQNIYNALPTDVRKTNLRRESQTHLYEKDSIFEFVIRNVTLQRIGDRYKQALIQLEQDDSELAEFIVLCAYMHNCHVPLSFEMAYDYFDHLNADSIFSLREDASDIVKDFIPLSGGDNQDMDYYYPRSLYVAESVLNSCSGSLLRRVLNTVLDKIPSFHICDYRVFKRYAFDKITVSRAFEKWEEGKSFYEKAFLYDAKNPYVLQQGALYLSQKHQDSLAFLWIDRAISMTDDHYFSIRNSHAIILFNANINKKDDSVRPELDRSMGILEKCMKDDARKRFHANAFGQQAIRYYGRFGDERGIDYLQQSKDWLEKEIKNSPWDGELRKTYHKICDILRIAPSVELEIEN